MVQKAIPLKASSFMTRDLVTVSPDVTFFDAVTLMWKHSIGNLIVKEDGRPVGLIGERQILQYLIDEGMISDRSTSQIATSLFTKISSDTSLEEAAKIRFDKKRKLLVFEGDSLVGILTTSDMIRGLKEKQKNPALDKVTTKNVITCQFEDKIIDQIHLMHEKRIGNVVVVKDHLPYGIFTERDLICYLPAIEADMNETVGRYCSAPLITADPSIRFKEAASIIAENKIKRLPLVRNNSLLGIVCVCDLLQAFVSQDDGK